MSPFVFLSISDLFPGLVCLLHVQIKLMGSFDLIGGTPWITDTNDALCFVCKRGAETQNHFLFDCPDFREHFDPLWSKLTLRVTSTAAILWLADM